MHKERLKQLADHLRTLPDGQWDFRKYVIDVNTCGTVGCALGHCPDLWPDNWRIVPYSENNQMLVLRSIVGNKGQWYSTPICSAAEWFDLPIILTDRLFACPSYYIEGSDDSLMDFNKVTKEMVADAIDKLISE